MGDGKIVQGKGYGLFRNIVIGAIGSLIGGYLFGFLGVRVHNTLGSIVTAVVGAIVLFLIFRIVRPGKASKGSDKKEKEGTREILDSARLVAILSGPSQAASAHPRDSYSRRRRPNWTAGERKRRSCRSARRAPAPKRASRWIAD